MKMKVKKPQFSQMSEFVKCMQNMRDKDGKRAIDICTTAAGRNMKHQQVANIIQGAQHRPVGDGSRHS